MPGETASFSVIAADTRGLSYQWQSNGTTLAGATSGALLLTNVSSANEAQYDVVLANGSGSITSAPAALMIDSRGVGMPDSWQLAYFGNLNQNPTGDFDGDGVNNLQEFLDGTNPTNAASALYRITLFSDGGTVVAVPSQSSYTNGQVVTLAATGSAEAPFHAWTGDVVTRSNAITVTMNTNLTLFAHFQPLTMNWTNTVSGDWSVPSNWFPNLVPGSNESVVIVNQALTVTLNGNADLRDLSLGGNSFSEPELKVAGRLTIAGLGTWEGGTMSGPGATVVLPGASFTIISVTTPTLNGRTLENAGTMSWMGGNLIMIGGVITNDAGAQFGVGGPGTFSFGGGTPRFDNAGTLVTAANGTTAFVGVAFNNYGAVTIQGGTFSLSGGGVQAGNMPVPAGTTVNFAGGTFPLQQQPVNYRGGHVDRQRRHLDAGRDRKCDRLQYFQQRVRGLYGQLHLCRRHRAGYFRRHGQLRWHRRRRAQYGEPLRRFGRSQYRHGGQRDELDWGQHERERTNHHPAGSHAEYCRFHRIRRGLPVRSHRGKRRHGDLGRRKPGPVRCHHQRRGSIVPDPQRRDVQLSGQHPPV